MENPVEKGRKEIRQKRWEEGESSKREKQRKLNAIIVSRQ